MRALAGLVAAAGIKRVTGDIVADASAFEKRVIPDGWLARYLQDSYAARVSALSLNGNLLQVAVTPGTSRKTAITLRPAVSGFKIVNQSVVKGTGRSGRLSVSQRSGNTIVVSGWIGSKSAPRVYTVVVEDPALFAASAFRVALEDQGIAVDGKIRFAPTPATATAIGSLSSPPLYQLAALMNGESDNHFAELLLRNASRGREHGIEGSAELANKQLRALLSERAGMNPDALSISDGSGLSSKDRVTPRAMTSLLSYANAAPWAREFHASLPVAGRTETLRNRMGNTPAQGNLHAKTGTTNDAIALSGFVTAASGELLAFSFLYNGQDRGSARETIDAMGATLAAFTRQ
jgi:D-alanyl-D-alanine carboxypeptidase/D-alanyl-D-alanine-endopeptidase (penicillin-binding protein 4)